MLDELKKYEPQDHPFKAIFRNAGVSQWTLANRCRASQSAISHYLGGRRKMPAHIEQVLTRLVKKIQAQA